MTAATTSRPAASRAAPGIPLLLACALSIASLSLLFPSTPSYDPWAWIIWGREITDWALLTDPGPSWKPLPVFFTVPFSLLGGAAPDLWLIIARAGGVLALWFGFSLTARLVTGVFPGSTGRSKLGPLLGGGFAVLLIATQYGFLNSVALGNSEGLLVAFVLWAVDRHLEGDERGAFMLGALAGLLRPETWPYLGAYGLWLILTRPRLRPLVFGVGIAIPLLWFVPEYIGSGNFTRAADRAQDAKRILPGSLSRDPHPFNAVVALARNMLGRAGQASMLLAVAAAIWAWPRRVRTPLVLLGAAGSWVLLVAAMTAAGYAGNPRYLLLATSLLAVVGGFGVGVVLSAIEEAVGRRRRAAGVVAVSVLGIAGFAAMVFAGSGLKIDRWTGLADQLRGEAAARDSLHVAVQAAGGRERLLACGQVTTHPLQVPMVAWQLEVPIGRVSLDPTGPGTALETRVVGGRLAPEAGPPGGRPVGTYGAWTVVQACPGVPKR